MSDFKLEARWLKDAEELLLGRVIVLVRFMTPEEAESNGWDYRPLVLHLDDGNLIYPSNDSEGNGPGVIFTNDDEVSTIPCMI